MYECNKVGLGFCETAPYCFRSEAVVSATPDQIFEAFEDPLAWPQWVDPIEQVTWTSPKPFGRGTTRTVTMKGGLLLEEEFIHWEHGKRMAFLFTRISKPLFEAVLEDYRVVDLGDGRCRVCWLFCLTPKGFMKLVFALGKYYLAWNNRRILNRFRRYVEGRYAGV